jgi:hypothetical protein
MSLLRPGEVADLAEEPVEPHYFWDEVLPEEEEVLMQEII